MELTSSHLGYFEFRLCPKRSAEELVTQECLDNYLLRLSDGSTRYQVPDYTATWYDMLVKLPDGLTCDHCVIQWYYTTGELLQSNTDKRSPDTMIFDFNSRCFQPVWLHRQ